MKHADHWFYVPESNVNEVVFPIEETVHAVKVLRVQIGDKIQWLDGRGRKFSGEVTTINKKTLKATVLSSSLEPEPVPTVLAVGQLHDATRMEWLVEKATELGVTQLLLLSTSRVERTRYKINRLEAKVISAVKQSGRVWVPQIREITFGEALDFCQKFDCRLLAHCHLSLNRVGKWNTALGNESACLFIGPEGDFTLAEINQATDLGFTSISLGNARLRTETAALAGLVQLRELTI